MRETNLERQARRDREARARIANDDDLREIFLATKKKSFLDSAKRMKCCGAPIGVEEDTAKYYKRHKYGLLDCPVSKPCKAAIVCRRVEQRRQQKSYRERKQNGNHS